MNDYPENTWIEKDIERMKEDYILGKGVLCPIDGNSVLVIKEQGEKHLKKKYVKTHFFLTYECSACGRRDTKTYRRSP